MLIDKKIKVLHVISTFTMGGAEKLLLNTLSNVRNNQQVEYSLLVLKDIVDKKMHEKLKSMGYKVIILKKEQYKNPLTLLKLAKIVKENKIDVIHAHEGGGKSWAILVKLLLPKVKLVYTSHGNNEFTNFNKLCLLAHKVLVDRSIIISEPIRKSCEKLGVKKIAFIPNGINLKEYCTKRSSKGNAGILQIINVSRINPSIKGQDVLIKALAVCKKKGINFHCKFVGGTYEYDVEALDYLKRLAKENNVENRVSFLGVREDIPDLLAKADLFVLTSRVEAMPLVLLEAMASALPVISSDIAGAKALINHGENGLLFESENHVDLAEKICNLYYERDKTVKIAQNGSCFVKSFDISVAVLKYHDLYKELANFPKTKIPALI